MEVSKFKQEDFATATIALLGKQEKIIQDQPAMHHFKAIWEDDRIASTLCGTEKSRERLKRLSLSLVRIFAQLNVQSIVDIGIGDGELVKNCMSLNPELQVVGLDFSHRLLNTAKSKLAKFGRNIKLIECDVLEELPQCGQVDAFLLARILHHMDRSTIKKLLSRLRDNCHIDTRVIVVERWAFIPKSEIEARFRKIRLAISNAMFPDIGEFHHSFYEYKILARESNYFVERTLWHIRQVLFGEYSKKINRWINDDLRTVLLSCLNNREGNYELPTMIMILRKLGTKKPK